MGTMKSYKTVLVDDEALVRERVRQLLRPYPEFVLVGEFENGEEALKGIESLAPEVIFLDIQMPFRNGFELLDSLKIGPNQAVIFITAYDQYALKAFDYGTIDYLLKPIDRKRFEQCLERVKVRLDQAEKSQQVPDKPLLVRVEGSLILIDQREIETLRSDGNYVLVQTADREYKTRRTLADVQQHLNPRTFCQIHRSWVINVTKVKKLEHLYRGDYLLTIGSSGRRVTSSQTYRENMAKLLSEFRQ